MEHHNLLEIQEQIAAAFADGMTYAEYHVLVKKHAETFTSTGHNPPESYAEYTVLNHRRMKRWDKVFKLTDEQKAVLENLKTEYNFTVITESWCGDAPPSVAVMNSIAQACAKIDLRVILRDDHPEIMDAVAVNGIHSIPKLIIQEKETGKIVTIWGSRPAILQQMFEDFKAEHGNITAEFREEIQQWYNKDKGKTIAAELIDILSAFN